MGTPFKRKKKREKGKKEDRTKQAGLLPRRLEDRQGSSFFLSSLFSFLLYYPTMSGVITSSGGDYTTKV